MLNPQPEQILPRAFWPFLAVALLSAAASQALLALAPGAYTLPYLRNPWMLASVHLAGLGWLGTLFLAVSVQAGPVLAHRDRGRTWAAWAGPGLFHAGALGLVAFMAGLRGWVWLGAALAGLFLGYAAEAGRLAGLAFGGAPRTRAWSGLAAAHAYLAALMALGSLMAVGLLRPLLPQAPEVNLEFHLHLALVGFAGMAVLGMLPKLLRLFLGATRYPTWPGVWAGRAVHAALSLEFLAWLGAGRAFSVAAALAVLAAALGLALQVLLQCRAASKPLVSSSFALQALALVWMLAAAGLDVARAVRGLSYAGDASLAYLALFGFVGGVLLGTIQRIVAVLAWMRRFWAVSSEREVPTAWGLIPKGPAWAAALLHAAAVPCGVLGLVWRSPGLIRLAGAAGCLGVLLTLALIPWALLHGRAGRLLPKEPETV